MTLVSPPVTTTPIQQNFFIEALGGSQNPISYLDRFPDAVYTKALDSLLVKFLYAIMGPTGVGLLRQQYLEARLVIEQAGLQTTDLDNLYSNAFSFARAAYETYQIDANANLLTASDRAKVLSQDASFRNRAINFLKGARGGATKQGLTLVANSGANRPVELVENYRSLFDHWTDSPLGLEDAGQTPSINEVIIIPRQDTPQSVTQTLSISGEPTQGWFTLIYPAGQQYMVLPYQVLNAANGTIQVSDATRFPPGAFVSLTNLLSPGQSPSPSSSGVMPTTWNNTVSQLDTNVVLYAESLGGTGTTVNLGGTLVGNNEGQPISIPSAANNSYTNMLVVGVAQTTPLPYNASAAQVSNALQALPMIGAGNVIVTGGPFPDQDIQIQFTNQLSDQNIPEIIFQAKMDPLAGITTARNNGPLADASGNVSTISVDVISGTVDFSADQQTTVISDADRSSLYTALNQTGPLTALYTLSPGEADVVRQPVSNSFTAANHVEVVRYETGRSIQWPAVDGTHWIEAGVEHEAPTVYGVSSQYQGFHNISNIISYTEGALNDPGYLNGSVDVDRVYWNSLVGSYSPMQLSLYPGLAALNSNNYSNQYLPENAQAPQPEPLEIDTINGINVINEIYPLDYMALSGVSQPAGGLLWASGERLAGVDYLEVDLGTAQPVNYLYFEATNKPYVIDVAYDLLDQAPQRNFNPVTVVAPVIGTSTLSLNYRATQLWSAVQINFNDSLGGMIYSRFLRIGFTKTPVGTVYQPIGQRGSVYSIEVRNLRVGRNVI
jgi:hypothetical protein